MNSSRAADGRKPARISVPETRQHMGEDADAEYRPAAARKQETAADFQDIDEHIAHRMRSPLSFGNERGGPGRKTDNHPMTAMLIR